MQIIFLILLLMVQKILISRYIIASFFLLLFSNSIKSQNLIKGKAITIDGDTIHINNNKIRLHGIDAPEIKQTCLINNNKWNCGIESKNALENLLLKKEVICEINDIDRYSRFIGICFINKKNINQYMVKNGWAIAYRYYSLDYIEEEEIAKNNKVGIWQGSFIEPYLFRKKNK